MSKKMISILLATCVMMGGIACSKQPGNSPSTDLGTATVWIAPATKKILRNGGMQNATPAEKIALRAAAGEYESVQLVVSSNGGEVTYDAEVSDLANGEEKISAENIQIYVAKYLNITQNYEDNGAPLGFYPDAMLPISVSVEYKENVVANGNNQSLYVMFKIPYEQKPGVYTGTLTLKLNGKDLVLPISLEVAAVSVSQEVNSRSLFSNGWNMASGELDSTQEMLNKYNAALLDYRLAPDVLMVDNRHNDEDIAYYTELAYTYLSDPRCSNISIPYRVTTGDNGYRTFDEELMGKYIMSFVDKSVKENFDMLAKCIVYFGGIIDEFDQFGSTEHAGYVMDRFTKTVTTLSETVSGMNIHEPLKSSLVNSIRNIRHIATSNYMDSLGDKEVIWCPLVQNCTLESQRDHYKDYPERWWYTCIQPRAPYPSYHIEDTLLSARLLGWMQAHYNVRGNLFWATNVYAQYDYNIPAYKFIDDYYQYPTRFPQVNGDGYLFYPGKQYGIDGPVASLRLFGIRDGLEEYEIIRALKNRYTELGNVAGIAMNTEAAVRLLTDSLYTGTLVTADDEKFASARENLLDLAELAMSDAGVCIYDYVDNEYGQITYRIFVKDGHELNVNGASSITSEKVAGGKTYAVTVDLISGATGLDMSVNVEGNILSFRHSVGSGAAITSAEKLVSSIADGDSRTNVTLADLPMESGITGKAVKIDMTATTLTEQSFTINGELFASTDKNTKTVYLHLYYDGEEPLVFSVFIKTENQQLYSELESVTLQRGINTVAISRFAKLNWTQNGSIEYAVCYLGTGSGQPARTVWLLDGVTYVV